MGLFSWISGQTQEKKFDFGFSIFPNNSIGLLSNDGSVSADFETAVRDLETWKPSMSANVFVEYKWNENSVLGIGMGYQNNGERTIKLDGFPGSVVNPSLPSQIRFVYNHHNIEIPIYYRQIFGERFFVQIGTSGVINLANTDTSVQYFVDGSKEKNTSPDVINEFRAFNFSGNFGVGFDYVSTGMISLFVLPYVQYGFLGVSKTAPLNRNYLSVGLSTGIRI